MAARVELSHWQEKCLYSQKGEWELEVWSLRISVSRVAEGWIPDVQLALKHYVGP